MGRPQVCTNVGGVSEAVGDAGFVVPPRDHAAVAEACVRLLEDADLRHSLGMLARQRVLERFTLDQWSKAYRELYAVLVPAAPPDGSATPIGDARPASQRAIRLDHNSLMRIRYSRIEGNLADDAREHSHGILVLHAEDGDASWYQEEPLLTPTRHHAMLTAVGSATGLYQDGEAAPKRVNGSGLAS